MQNEYKNTKRRTTNELESDDTALPITKRELMYGWTGADKLRIKVDSSGYLVVVPSDLAPATGSPIGLLITLTYS